jgi:glutamate synthase domain-containing protein 2
MTPLMYLGAVAGAVVALVALVAFYDVFIQKSHTLLHNFPVIARFRYLAEELGPPLRQYFVAKDTEERPYDRTTRSWIYQSSKGVNNVIGFGSQVDHNASGKMHILPSMFPTLESEVKEEPRPRVIGKKRGQPYQPQSFVNISGMSFGALSATAVRSLSRGAKLAHIYMGTGEGSLSPYHLDGDCDILYQIGPAKFGVRTADGQFDDKKAAQVIALPQVKMVEIKLAQGAKPGKGGVLPAAKVTPEIAAIRNIPLGKDCHSPNRFEEFHDVPTLLDFLERVRKLTDKPVGFKLVVGQEDQIDALCREIVKRKDGPDFIVVDGKEGGSGAAPLALADYVGQPLIDGLTLVDDKLREYGLRDDVTLIGSGRIATGGDAAIHIALGADIVHIARGFLFSLGCIQALRCHNNTCPTGITTQNKWLQAGIDPTEKSIRVQNYAKALQKDLNMIVRACGLKHPSELHRAHVVVNISPGVRKTLEELFPYPQVKEQPKTRATSGFDPAKVAATVAQPPA